MSVAEVPQSGSYAPDVAACKEYLLHLLKRTDVAELGGYLDAIETWGAKKKDTPEFEVHAFAERAFQAAVRRKARQIVKLIKGGLWESDRCVQLHLSVVSAHASLVAMNQDGYVELVEKRNAFGVQDDLDDEEEHVKEFIDEDGYASEDSDDEFADDLYRDDFQPGFDVEVPKGGSRAVQKKKKSRLKKKMDRIVRGTFRYQGKNEPSPNEILQRVATVRDEAKKIDFGREQEHLGMAAIHYTPEEWTAKVQRDFEAAKKLFAEGNIEGLQALDTQFCIAQYRGVTYKTTQFDSRARRISRAQTETGRGIYSFSAMRAANVTPSDYFGGRCSKKELETLVATAEKLKQVLLEKRKPQEVRVGGIRFDSHADAIQQIYTNEYDYFHSSVARFLANREHYLEDQKTNLAVVRRKAHEDGTLARRLREIVTYGNFHWQVGELRGVKANDEQAWARYADRAGWAVPDKVFQRLAIAGKIQYRESQYPQYKNGRDELPMDLWTRLVADFAGREQTVESYVQYTEDINAENEQVTAAAEAEAVAKYLKARYGFIPPDDWQLFDGLLNGDCPFVSTGDNPRHALKYAYGMKFYAGHYGERLNPDWNEEGVARRPYSGKVFVTLHSLPDYLEDAPNHVPSMNLHGRIIIGEAIADEREATFPSYIAGKRCIIEHIAKLPSFPSEDADTSYRRVHLLKYGLDRELYTELHTDLRKAQAEELEAAKKKQQEKKKKKKKEEEEKDDGPMAWFLQKICAWLVNYQETRLVEIARRSAMLRGMFLVYRNSLGELDCTPTPVSVSDAVRLPSHLKLASQNPMEIRRMRSSGEGADPKNKQEIIKKQRDAWLNPRVALRQHLTRQYDIHATAPDGNCLFHALATIVQREVGQQFTHVTLRTLVVRRLRRSRDLRATYDVSNAYLDEMAQPAVMAGQLSRWGGDAEIAAFCRVFGAAIRVYAPTYFPPTYSLDYDAPDGRNPSFTGFLYHVHGNHWEWLSPKAV